MKATELMIGDLVIHGFGSIGKITEIDSKTVVIKDDGFDTGDGMNEVSFALNELTPIPLTPEILKQNGFTGGEYKSYTGDVWYLKEEGFRKIGLTMSRKESTLWGEKIKPLSPDSIGHNFAVPNIKYVHELQHALRLCGINKVITI